MKNWELNLINRIPTGLIVGWSFYQPIEEDEQYNFYEANLFLLIIQIQFRWNG